MDFNLTDEQTMLKESVERFVATSHDFERAKANAASPDGFSREDWARFAELGWLMLMIPESSGGLGGSPEDAAILMEGFGKGLVAAPFVPTAVLAPRLLAGSPDHEALLGAVAAGETLVALATEETRSRYQPARIETQARRVAEGGFVLSGNKIVVQDGPAADLFLVSALLDGEPALFLVDRKAPGVSAKDYRTIDRRRACDLGLEDSPAERVGSAGIEALELALDEASLMLAAEALGCMEAAMALTADYLKTRQQFGRPLAKFQVLTHRLADMFVRTENARSMLLRGLAALDSPPERRAAAVSATMVTAIAAAEFVCGQAIQLHGGIGMAEENEVGHFYKRIRAIGRTYGDLDHHRARHARLTQRRAA